MQEAILLVDQDNYLRGSNPLNREYMEDLAEMPVHYYDQCQYLDGIQYSPESGYENGKYVHCQELYEYAAET